MFKKILLPVAMGILLSFATMMTWAAIGDRWAITNEGGTDVVRITSDGELICSDFTCGTGAISATEIADVERFVSLPLMSFAVNDAAPITASSAPNVEKDDAILNIVWADGETTAISITFRVPADYVSGGVFRLLCTESDSTTPNQVDFDVYVNKDGQAVDSSVTGQTPVALAGTTSTPDEITLTVATDFASLAAGDWVTFRVWRDDVADGTGDLEIKGASFFYTATQ